MTMNIRILIIFLIFSNLVTAETITNEMIREVFTVLGIILASIFVLIGLISFVIVILKCIKRKITEPQYYIDEISINKDSSECNVGNNGTYYQAPYIIPIQPNLSIRHIIVSVKQSLIDLRDSLIPFSWSQVQHIDHQQQSPTDEKLDLSN